MHCSTCGKKIRYNNITGRCIKHCNEVRQQNNLHKDDSKLLEKINSGNLKYDKGDIYVRY